MEKYLFEDAPEDVVRSLAELRKFTEPFIREIASRFKKYGATILHANRPVTEPIGKTIPVFSHGFVGSNSGVSWAAKEWLTAENLNPGNHLQFAWASQELWGEIRDVVKKTAGNVLIMPSYCRPQHDELKELYGEKLVIASPSNYLSRRFGGDKRDMTGIYEEAGLIYPNTHNFTSVEEVGLYQTYANEFGKTIVIQATMGAGGLTNNGNRAIFFCVNKAEFEDAKEKLSGEGPVRVMKFFEGMSGNSSGLALPFGTFVSCRPSTKPCGKAEVNGFFGASAGNQWDNFFPQTATEEQYGQLVGVGNIMAKQGYYGIFGLDPIINISTGKVFNSEINARAQGPDEQREAGAIAAGVLSLYTMQLGYYLGIPEVMFPDTTMYNMVTQWLKIPAYLKIFAPHDFIAKNNINGDWRLVDGTEFVVCGGPNKGEKCSPAEGFNLAYLKFKNPDTKIFDVNGNFTNTALEAVRDVYSCVGVEVK